MISLDIDVVTSVKRLGLNVSNYCNEKLWDYITEMEAGEKVVSEKKEDIKKSIIELQEKERNIEKAEKQRAEMEGAGMTDDKLKFLKNMNANIMNAKNAKEGWERKFSERLEWSDLIELKRIWT